jgi:exopolysaccharide biosynthesis polyprenyl glycosylphosphotransferase
LLESAREAAEAQERERTRRHVALASETASRKELWSLLDERTIQRLERRSRAPQLHRRGWLVHRLLVAADLIGLVLAFAVAELVVPRLSHGILPTWVETTVFVASLPLWIVVAKLYGLYDRDSDRSDHSTADEFIPLFHMLLVSTCGFWLVARATGLAQPQTSKLLAFFVAALGCLTIMRASARAISQRRPEYLQNTVIVGAGDVGQRIAEKLLQHPEYGVNLVGFVDAQPKERRESLAHLTLLGTPEQLPAIIRMLDVERVVVAFSNEPNEETLTLLRSLKHLYVQVDIVPRFFEVLGPGVGMHTIEGLPLLGLPPMSLSRSSSGLKRAMDLAVGVACLVLLSPLLLAIAIAIKVDSRGPVFFRQERMGLRNEVFRIWKFRSMVVDAEERKRDVAHLNMHAVGSGDPRMFKIPEDPRTTRVGRFLRRYSIDELPQLLNVVSGEMSLVGPRPLILDEDRHVQAWGRRRLDLKPGITGPWQVLGRSGIPFNEMVNLDYLYVTGWSLWGDVQLMMKTLPVFLRSANGEHAIPSGRGL